MINKVLEWSACAVTIAGAACTAANWDPLNIYLLNLGAILYLIWSVRVKIVSLVLINSVLLFIYLYGAAMRSNVLTIWGIGAIL
jgi:hypothetical protein